MNPIASAGLKFFLRFLLVYIVLTALSLIPAVGSIFHSAYRPAAQGLLQVMYPKAYIKAQPSNGVPETLSIEYASKELIRQQQTGRTSNFKVPGKAYNFKFYNLFLSFYILLVSLIVLSPLPRRELMVSLILGTILFYLYTLFKVALTFFVILERSGMDVLEVNPGVLKVAKGVLYYQSMGTTVLIVLLIWAGLVFRKGNWQAMLK